MHLLLVCSSGGHLLEIFNLREYWHKYPRTWVTFKSDDAESLLEGENVLTAYHPTNRNIKNLLKNLWLAFGVIKNERPTTVISTGAGVAVPFIYIAKIFGIKSIYIESITRVNELSLTGRMIYPVVDHLLVQWPELAAKHKKTVYKGSVL